jgi:DNA polymerase/3'-5' exonuclease PolX
MALPAAIDARIARALAQKIAAELAPACDRIEIAGSLRRNAPQVHDIDLVVLPSGDGTALNSRINELISRGSLTPVRAGEKIQCFIASKTGIQVDMYIADQRTWPTLLLIRTGSKDHNIRLAMRAKELGMKLRASGDGIEDSAGGIICMEKEEDIFALLKLAYRRPEERT